MTRLLSYFLLVLIAIAALLLGLRLEQQNNEIEHWIDSQLITKLTELNAGSTQISLDSLHIPAQQLTVWRGDQLIADYQHADHQFDRQLILDRAPYRIEAFIKTNYQAVTWDWILWFSCWLLLVVPTYLLIQRFNAFIGQLKQNFDQKISADLPTFANEIISQQQQQREALELAAHKEHALLDEHADLKDQYQLQHSTIHQITQASQSAHKELHWLKGLLQQLNHRGLLTGLGFEIELLKRFLHSPTQAKLQPYPSVAEWYAQTFRKPLASILPGTRVILDEDPTALQYKIALDQHECTLAIECILRELKPLIQNSEIELGYRLVTQPTSAIELSFKYQGFEFSTRFQKILRSEATQEPSLQDLPVHVLQLLIQQRGYRWQLDSVTGVGGKLCLTIPATVERVNQGKKYQTLCLLDALECRAKLYRNSLQTVAEQIIWARHIDDLHAELKLRLVDKVLALFDEAPEAEVCKQLEDVAQRYSVQACAESLYKAPEDSKVHWSAGPLFTADLLKANESMELGRQQLLVVDDNPVNMNYVETMMASMGVKVDKAFTGEEALHKARHNIYHVMLMDIQLPDISGIEVTRQVRQMRHHQMTNIIAFTAHAMPDEVASFRLAGMDDVLIKPMDSRKIAHLVHRLNLSPEIQ